MDPSTTLPDVPPSPESVRRLRSLAKRARESAAKTEALTAARDRAIRQMSTDGASLRTIAEAAGLSHTMIANILKKSADG